MHLQYDAEVDVLVVSLGDLSESMGAEEIAPGVYLDKAEDGTVLGLEILDASKRYPVEELREHPARYDQPIPLVDAARTLDVTPQALQKAIVRGRLEGKKIGKTWTTTVAALTQYMNSRAHEGPGSRAEEEGTVPAAARRRQAALAESTPSTQARRPKATR